MKEAYAKPLLLKRAVLSAVTEGSDPSLMKVP